MSLCRHLRTDKRRPWLGNALVLGSTAIGQATALLCYGQALAPRQ